VNGHQLHRYGAIKERPPDAVSNFLCTYQCVCISLQGGENLGWRNFEQEGAVVTFSLEPAERFISADRVIRILLNRPVALKFNYSPSPLRDIDAV
jgi:hypothetical protein